MYNGHIVIDCNGMETIFDSIGNINFDRDQLLVTVRSQNEIAGWHWDGFAALFQHLSDGSASLQGHEAKCEAMLGFKGGQEKLMTVSGFKAVELNPSSNLVLIKGSTHSAFINCDFLKWYRIYNRHL
ncbi:hypothetical protein MTBBW1_830049 [Desulfamplus magnetovallimortis]|uniref:Uncharacterized protein n=1 Tax=Desulfamplus magnetovallimortis TaxID=1246637 RepID=A0A1W1HKD1_9BACT|nr:hypothetical protein [Desulfamplus magnetovallimortis]SLM32977.1 hypothetical protein MTBBW1_830049 [Desulfamplus magnetovallimortis]